MKLIRYQYPQSPRANAINRLFDLGAPAIEHFGSILDDFFSNADVQLKPAVDLYGDADNYYARFELPGIEKDRIDIELENSVLTIQSLSTDDDESTSSEYRFRRAITVPDGIDVEQVTAQYEAGLLTITLPKEVARKPRQITVN